MAVLRRKVALAGFLPQSLAQGQHAGPAYRILHNIGYRINIKLHAQHGLPLAQPPPDQANQTPIAPQINLHADSSVCSNAVYHFGTRARIRDARLRPIRKAAGGTLADLMLKRLGVATPAE